MFRLLKPFFGSLFLSLLFVQLSFAGEIAGKISYEGKVPRLRALKLDADPDCASKHSSPPKSEALVLGEGNTMGNVFVQITKGVPEKEYSAPSEPVVVAQEGCIYKPHVVGVMAGQTVKFQNNDGLLHNVHALPKKNREFNLGMPATMKEAEKSFSKPEMLFPVKCDVHPWMGAYVAVLSHPYFDVTGADGAYSIKGLPAGTYEVEVWHEKLKTRTQTVTIGESETKTADFTYSRPSKKKG